MATAAGWLLQSFLINDVLFQPSAINQNDHYYDGSPAFDQCASLDLLHKQGCAAVLS